jgi:hypothetical protein
VGAAGATVGGTIDPRGREGSWQVEYGTTSRYGRATAPTPVAGSGARDVGAVLTGLAPGTTYHWRITLATTAGTVAGADATFTTPASTSPPSAAPSPTRAGVARAASLRILDPRCPPGATASRCATHRRSVAAWATLRGVLVDRGARRPVVEVSVVRRDGSRCAAFDGAGFRSRACRTAVATWVRVRPGGPSWQLRLPGLRPGLHEIRARSGPAGGPRVVVRRLVRLR